MTCEAQHGLCVKCYGKNLARNKIVEIGVVNNGVVNEVNREYIKFNGDFTDWSKKEEFIEGNTTNK